MGGDRVASHFLIFMDLRYSFRSISALCAAGCDGIFPRDRAVDQFMLSGNITIANNAVRKALVNVVLFTGNSPVEFLSSLWRWG